MAATTRRARNYKEKNTVFTFGHFALPVAAVIALGLLFVGIKLFFLAPPNRPAATPVGGETAAAQHSVSAPLMSEPDFSLAEGDGLVSGFTPSEPEKLETNEVTIVMKDMAGPISSGVPRQSSAASKTKQEAHRAPQAQAAKTQPQVPSPAANAAAGSKWGVQIGAFVNAESASTVMSEANKQGYPASVSKVASSGKTFHRVRVGAGNTREDANRLASELEGKGYPVSVVPML